MKKSTSLKAFEKIKKELTKRQMQIYEKVSTFPGITIREAANKMKVTPNVISGRFSELERMGVIKDNGVRYFKDGIQPHCKWILR